MSGLTLFQKLWDAHVVHVESDGTTLLYIDRHLVHEVTSPQAFEGLKLADRKPRRADAAICRGRPQRADHRPQRRASPTRFRACRWKRSTPTAPNSASPNSRWTISARASSTSSAPKQGATLPGMTVVCGDSHTSHARRVRRAGVRHRHLRSRARAGHAMPVAEDSPKPCW